MEEDVRKELETLKGMVVRWKREYLGWAPPDGGGEFLANELLEEIDLYVYPYVKRMYECGYLSGPEVQEFLDFCYNQVEDLRDAVKDAEAKELHLEEGRHA